MRSEDFVKIDRAVEEELQNAIEFARESPFPAPEEALNDVYSIGRKQHK
jgi:TPP-dependent pyruvate/acetoin dehydrogenase alpha subunit